MERAAAKKMACTRAGFVGLIGRPNVGKSTLLNRILGQKLVIASPRPQTTRNRIIGVHNVPGAQLVFVDTPGIHKTSGKGRTRLNKFMVEEAMQALGECDVVALIIDRPEPVDVKRLLTGAYVVDAGNRFILEELKRVKKPALLVVNKLDAMRDKGPLLPLLAAYNEIYPFAGVVPISALTGEGVDLLQHEIVQLLPEGEALFPEDMLTDRAERWLCAEFVREQVFLRTQKEIPYAVAVTVDTFKEREKTAAKPASIMMEATIHVEKSAQKKIVVGRAGTMIRDIGMAAREQMAQLLDCEVHLKLFVRVDDDWSERPALMREMGYEAQ